MGFIQTNQHCQLLVINGRDRHKARDPRALVRAVELLARAALAADTIARQRGLLARTVGHDALHQAAHRGGRLGADDLPLHHRLRFLYNSAVRGGDLRHDVGLHEPPAVHDRADRRQHLQIADLAALPEGAACQLDRPHLVGRVILAAFDLARQVDARGFPQAEGCKIVAEALFSKPRTDLDKAGVAADGQPLGKGLCPVDMPVRAAEPRTCDGNLARAGEIVRCPARAGIQRCRRRDELEDAARFVQIADGLVAPLRLLRLLQRGAALLACQGVHGVADVLVNQGARRVGVVVGLAGHRQHRAGVHVHDDADAPLGHMVLGHSGGKGAFQPVLDVRVDRQRQRVAGHGVHQCLVVGGQVVPPRVLCGQDASVLPGQFVVVAQFQPPQPRIVHIGEAQDPAHKIPLRVNAAGILPDLHALHLVFATPVPHGVGYRPVDAAAQQAVVGAALAEFCQCVGVIQLQNLTQRTRGGLDLVVRHLARGGADRPAGLAGGQQRTVGGINLPACGGQRRAAQLLVGRPRCVAAGVAQHQDKQPHDQPAQAPHGQHRRQQPGAQPHLAVLLRCDVTHISCPLPHTIQRMKMQ